MDRSLGRFIVNQAGNKKNERKKKSAACVSVFMPVFAHKVYAR